MFCAVDCDCTVRATVRPLQNLGWSVVTPTAPDFLAEQTPSCAEHLNNAVTGYPTPAYETQGCEAVIEANAENAVSAANVTVSPRRAPVTSIHWQFSVAGCYCLADRTRTG